jgi:hypothetical protein
MICSDPNYWTKEKLIGFEKDEKNLYQQWDDGNVLVILLNHGMLNSASGTTKTLVSDTMV